MKEDKMTLCGMSMFSNFIFIYSKIIFVWIVTNAGNNNCIQNK